MKNFFLFLFLSFTGGVLLSSYIPEILFFLIPFFILVPIIEKSAWSLPVFFTGVFLTGAFLSHQDSLEDTQIKRVYAACFVTSPPYFSPDFTAFSCRVFESDFKPLEGRKVSVYLRWEDRDIFAGSSVSFFGRGYIQDGRIKLYPYRGFFQTLNDRNPLYPVAWLKNFLIDRYRSSTVDESAFALGMALIFGERGYISRYREEFINAGTSHLLAISGMHVGILILILLFITSFIGRVSYYITAMFLVIYPLFTGLQVPVVRASMLGILYLYSKIRYLRVNPFGLLFFVAFVILLFSPESVYSVSFQLSFIAVAGLLLFRDIFSISSGGKVVNFIAGSFLMSVVALVFTLPVIAYHFGKFSLTTVIATPVLVILLFPYLFLSALNLFTFFSIKPLVLFMDYTGLFFLHINSLFSELPAVYTGYSPSLLAVFAVLCILIGVHLSGIRPFFRLIVSVFAVLVFLSITRVKDFRPFIYVKKGPKKPYLAVIVPYGECFFNSRKLLYLLDKYGCREKIPLRYAGYTGDGENFSYKTVPGGYIVNFRGRSYTIKNGTYIIYPEK